MPRAICQFTVKKQAEKIVNYLNKIDKARLDYDKMCDRLKATGQWASYCKNNGLDENHHSGDIC